MDHGPQAPSTMTELKAFLEDLAEHGTVSEHGDVLMFWWNGGAHAPHETPPEDHGKDHATPAKLLAHWLRRQAGS